MTGRRPEDLRRSWWGLLVAGSCLVVATSCGSAPASSPVSAATASKVPLDAGIANCVQPQKSVERADPHAGVPNRLEIPALGVAVDVVPVGLTDGRLVPPSDPHVVGWWKGGAQPGAAKGTAILTGHTVSTGGGAFNNLKDLHAGDRIVVRTSRGDIEYRIVEVAYYPKSELARLSKQLFSQAVAGRLVLSTCSNFDGKAYRGNTLAFATPQP